MKNVACVAMIMACSLAVFAKDKTTFQIEVLGTDAWQRDVAIHHAATNGTSNTNCDTNGSVNTTTVGDYSNGSVNATTNCTTTTAPGTPAYVTHRSIQQESVHAVCQVRRGRHHRVNQLGLAVHSDVRFHPEVPLLALARLMHLRIPLLAGVLGRTRCVDNRRIHDRPGTQT